MASLRLASVAWQIGSPGGVAGWAARLRATVEAAGAQMVVCPEYAPLEAFATPPGAGAADLAGELARAIDGADTVIRAAASVARGAGVWLLAGSLPMRTGDTVRNRAILAAPSGEVVLADKHVMTRFEDEQWHISGGAPPGVVETPWGRIGIAICFDGEFPNLVRAQVEAGAFLILMPSCTDTAAGFERVRIAARARAMENQCFVALAPTVGTAPWSAALDVNRGQALICGPMDHGFPADGILAASSMDVPGIASATIDPAALEAVRAQGQVQNHRRWPAGAAAPLLVPHA
ncbi:MAG: carbon-nitrogen hydrolase [Rhodospirillales bacterium]|nr:carbon-nitrogen hydrolase [Rhodospirillales bacterium]